MFKQKIQFIMISYDKNSMHYGIVRLTKRTISDGSYGDGPVLCQCKCPPLSLATGCHVLPGPAEPDLKSDI